VFFNFPREKRREKMKTFLDITHVKVIHDLSLGDYVFLFFVSFIVFLIYSICDILAEEMDIHLSNFPWCHSILWGAFFAGSIWVAGMYLLVTNDCKLAHIAIIALVGVMAGISYKKIYPD
jgi:hypothetical protein